MVYSVNQCTCRESKTCGQLTALPRLSSQAGLFVGGLAVWGLCAAAAMEHLQPWGAAVDRLQTQLQQLLGHVRELQEESQVQQEHLQQLLGEVRDLQEDGHEQLQRIEALEARLNASAVTAPQQPLPPWAFVGGDSLPGAQNQDQQALPVGQQGSGTPPAPEELFVAVKIMGIADGAWFERRMQAEYPRARMLAVQAQAFPECPTWAYVQLPADQYCGFAEHVSQWSAQLRDGREWHCSVRLWDPRSVRAWNLLPLLAGSGRTAVQVLKGNKLSGSAGIIEPPRGCSD